MTKTEILNEIEEYEAVVNASSSSDLEIRLAKEEIADLKLKLEKLEGKTPPAASAPPKKRGRKPGSGRKIRPKKSAEPLDGPAVDRNGHPLEVGDFVTVFFKGKAETGHINALQKLKGGGHSVKLLDLKGKSYYRMASKAIVEFISRAGIPVISTENPLPQNIIAAAQSAGRRDCDENEIILVKPKKRTAVKSPIIADPDNGDRIGANKQGYPMYVIEGEAVKNDYKITGEADIEANKAGEVIGLEKKKGNPEALKKARAAKAEKLGNIGNHIIEEVEEAEVDSKERPDKKIKAVRPPHDCEFLRGEEEDANALQVTLEGWRARFKSEDSNDKIIRVLLRKSDNRVVLEIKRYNFIDIPLGLFYYEICLETGRLTKIKKPASSEVSSIYGEDKMRDFYRHPNQNTCRRASKELYTHCYREGACDQSKRQRLLEIINHKCRKRETEVNKAYQKFVHAATGRRWKGYEGKKSYYMIYREVLADLKAGKKIW